MTLEQSDKVLEKKYLPKRPIEDVIEIVAQSLGISESMIRSGSRLKNISNARALISYIASETLGHSLASYR